MLSSILKIIKKKIVLIVIVLVLFFLGFVFFGGNGNGDIDEFTLVRTTVSDDIELAGTINLIGRADLGFGMSGRVSRVFVKEGDRVKEGQKIAQISMNSLSANLTSARAEIALINAESALEDTNRETAVKTAFKNLLNNDLQVYSTDSNDNTVAPTISGFYNDDEIGEIKIEIYRSASKSGYSYRLSGLVKGTGTVYTGSLGPIADTGLYIQFDDDANYVNSEWVIPIPNIRSNSYSTVEGAYEQALAADENQTRLQGGSSMTRSDAQINRINEQIKGIYAEMQDGIIKAPFSGTIAKIDLTVGEIAVANTSVVTVTSDQGFELKLFVPEIDVTRLTVGDQVEIIRDIPDTEILSGEISFIDTIDSRRDGVPVYETKVKILDLDDTVRAGMNARARVALSSKENVLAVPKKFLKKVDDDQENTYTVMLKTSENSEVQRLDIKTGLIGSDGMIEILQIDSATNLKEGDILLSWNSDEE